MKNLIILIILSIHSMVYASPVIKIGDVILTKDDLNNQIYGYENESKISIKKENRTKKDSTLYGKSNKDTEILSRNYSLVSHHIKGELIEKYVPKKLQNLNKKEKEFLKKQECYLSEKQGQRIIEVGLQSYKIEKYIYESFNGTNYRMIPFILTPLAVDANRNLYNKAIKDKFIVIYDEELSKPIIDGQLFNLEVTGYEVRDGFPNKPPCGKLIP